MKQDNIPETAYINPFTYFSFQKLWGTEQSKPQLIDFLNALLTPAQKIQDITYLHKVQLDMLPEDRRPSAGIYGMDEQGRRLIMEHIKGPFTQSKRLYGALLPLWLQEAEKLWDDNFKEVTAIYFLQQARKEDPEGAAVHEVNWADIDTCEVFDKSLNYWYIELSKFVQKADELVTRLDSWLYVLNNLKDLTGIPEFLQDDEIFKQFFETAAITNLTREELKEYFASMPFKYA